MFFSSVGVDDGFRVAAAAISSLRRGGKILRNACVCGLRCKLYVFVCVACVCVCCCVCIPRWDPAVKRVLSSSEPIYRFPHFQRLPRRVPCPRFVHNEMAFPHAMSSKTWRRAGRARREGLVVLCDAAVPHGEDDNSTTLN